MKGRFIVKIDGTYVLFTDYAEIRVPFDEIIAFEPEIPDPPHTEEEHAEIMTYTARYNDLLRRNRAARNETR